MNLPPNQILFILGEVYGARVERREPDWRNIASMCNRKFRKSVKPITAEDAREVDDNYVKLRSGLAEK